jgi:hypothetical protein
LEEEGEGVTYTICWALIAMFTQYCSLYPRAYEGYEIATRAVRSPNGKRDHHKRKRDERKSEYMTSGQGCGDKGRCTHEFDRSELTGQSPCSRLCISGQEGLKGTAPGAEKSTGNLSSLHAGNIYLSTALRLKRLFLVEFYRLCYNAMYSSTS